MRDWISSKSSNHLNVPNKAFVSVQYPLDIKGYLRVPSYHVPCGEVQEDLQRQGQVSHAFCLGGVLCRKFLNGSPIKLLYERYSWLSL